jgi:hypothetical protein
VRRFDFFKKRKPFFRNLEYANLEEKTDAGDVCINGLIPVNDLPENDPYHELKKLLLESAEEFSPDTLWERPVQSIYTWGSGFEDYLDAEGEAITQLAQQGFSCYPWDIYKVLFPDSSLSSVFPSQGIRPSCAAHAGKNAYQVALLTSIARGLPLDFTPINPIYTFWISKNYSLIGGQVLSEMAIAYKDIGSYTFPMVGNDVISPTRAKATQYADDAKNFQASLVFLPQTGKDLVDAIFRVAKAGLGVAVGNSHAVSGVTTDENKVKLARLSGAWAHSVMLSSYRELNGKRYVFWWNSHGPIYKGASAGVSDEGCPYEGAWMDDATLTQFAKSFTLYGEPYTLLTPEAVVNAGKIKEPVLQIPFSPEFRR